MLFPDFLVIGAQKAGTSWLHRNLSSHPGIWTPPLKELHYFDQRIQEPSFGALVGKLLGKRYYAEDWYNWFWLYQLKLRLQQHRQKFELEKALWDLRFFMRSPSDRWYVSLFQHAGGKVAGEATPEYSILEEDTIARVHNIMPDGKLIFSMRNPLERNYSQATMMLALRGQNPATATYEQFLELIDHEGFRQRTDYLKTLERWRRFYSDEQIFVVFMEDIHFRPVSLLRSLYRFLRVDPSYARNAITRKVHSRSGEKMPTKVAIHLAQAYHKDLQTLSTHFGGYTSFWLYCAEKLTSNDLSEDLIEYPLWESWLWEEWSGEARSPKRVESQDGTIQSRSLAQFTSGNCGS